MVELCTDKTADMYRVQPEPWASCQMVEGHWDNGNAVASCGGEVSASSAAAEDTVDK